MSEIVTNKEFIKNIELRYKIDSTQIGIVSKALFKAILKTLLQNKSVCFDHFGYFRVKHIKGRRLKNGKLAPSYYKTTFSFSKKAKDYMKNKIKLKV